MIFEQKLQWPHIIRNTKTEKYFGKITLQADNWSHQQETRAISEEGNNLIPGLPYYNTQISNHKEKVTKHTQKQEKRNLTEIISEEAQTLGLLFEDTKPTLFSMLSKVKKKVDKD